MDLRLKCIAQAIADDNPHEMWRIIEWATNGGQFGGKAWSDLTAPFTEAGVELVGLMVCAAGNQSTECFKALAIDAFDRAKWQRRSPAIRDALERQFASSLREWHTRISVQGMGDRPEFRKAARIAVAAFALREAPLDAEGARIALTAMVGLPGGSEVVGAITDGSNLALTEREQASLGELF